MSTKNLVMPRKLLGVSYARCSKQSAVSTEQETFSDFVRRVANEKGLSQREVARRGGISSPSISDIISGKTREVKASTIAALARGLGIPDEEVYAAYRGKSGDPNFDKNRFGQMSLKFDRALKLVAPDSRVNIEALVDLLDRELDRILEEEQRRGRKKKR